MKNSAFKVGLLIVGCSGAGKGSLVKAINALIGLDHIETGPWCRAHPDHQKDADAGKIVSNDAILGYVGDRLDCSTELHAGIDCPRTGEQAVAMVALLRGKGYNYIYTVYVKTSEVKCRSRMAIRATLENRPDDGCLTATARRFANFATHRRDILDAAHKHTRRMFLVDGDGDIDSLNPHAHRIALETGMLAHKQSMEKPSKELVTA